MYDILELNKRLLAELRDIAKELKIKRVESYKKQDLIYKILDTQAIVVSESKSAQKENAPKSSDKVSEAPKKRPGRPKKKRNRKLRQKLKSKLKPRWMQVTRSPQRKKQ